MSSGEGGYNLYSPGSTGWSTLRNEEFQEEDIWRVLRGTKLSNPNLDSYRESSTGPRHPPSASKLVPKPNKEPKLVQQHSAPVHIPDWSKIYGSSSSNKKASHNASWLDNDGHGDDGGGGGCVVINNSWDSDDDDEEEDEDGDGNWVPPHEWLARKLARTQISSFSVCEGVGRTLKGRDLSNVRNAVLTKTGFLE